MVYHGSLNTPIGTTTSHSMKDINNIIGRSTVDVGPGELLESVHIAFRFNTFFKLCALTSEEL